MVKSDKTDRLSIYLVQPKFPPTIWGMENLLRMTPYHAVFPPLGLLTLAALAPKEYRVTVCDENAGEQRRLRYAGPGRGDHRVIRRHPEEVLHAPDGRREFRLDEING